MTALVKGAQLIPGDVDESDTSLVIVELFEHEAWVFEQHAEHGHHSAIYRMPLTELKDYQPATRRVTYTRFVPTGVQR